MIRGFRQIASLTALSRVFGMLRTILYFYFFGASGLLDAWFIAFKIPNLSRRLFGEGAASASLIPVYSEQLHKDPNEAGSLANTVLTVIFVLLAALVLLGWTGIWIYQTISKSNSETRLILSLTSIMLPYMIIICLVAVLAGVLNVHRHFASPAAAPIVLNIFIIGSLCIGGRGFGVQAESLVFVVAATVLVAGLVQLAIQIPPLQRGGISIRPQWQIHTDAFKKIIMMMGPMILGLTVTQINTLFDDLIAWWFSGSAEKGNVFLFLGNQITYPLRRGCVSHLNGAQRLYQLPLGVLGISLATAVFPVMSADAAKKNFDALCKTISRGIRAAVFVAIPATAGLLLVAKTLVSATFEHGKFTAGDADATAFTLLFYALGLSGFFIQQIVTRAFYSTKDSKMPARSAMIAVCVNIVLNLTLIWFMGTAGLALSTALCSYLQVAILILALRRKFGNSILDGLMTTLIKTIIAAILMWLLGRAILFLCKDLPTGTAFDVLRLAIVVPAAAAAYWIAAKCLRIRMLSLITGSPKNTDFNSKNQS